MSTAHAPGPGQALAPDSLGPLLSARWFGAGMGLAVALLAVLIGLLIPVWVSPVVLTEGGPIERSTVWIYGLAVACTLMLRWPGRPRRDIAAAALLLLAMAAREADLHKALFGTSILKLRFYLDATAALPVLEALAILLPVVVAGLWLLARHGRRWLRPPASWNAPMVSMATLVAAMVFAKIMDRTPATLGELHLLQYTPQALLYVMLSLEEILECALPVFAVVVLLQCRLLGQRSHRVKT